MGQMNVKLLKTKVKSDFDSYKMTIQKANSVSLGRLPYYILPVIACQTKRTKCIKGIDMFCCSVDMSNYYMHSWLGSNYPSTAGCMYACMSTCLKFPNLF